MCVQKTAQRRRRQLKQTKAGKLSAAKTKSVVAEGKGKKR